MPYLYLKADIYPDPAKRAEALAAYQELIADALNEPGCLLYDLVEDPKDPSVWYMFEKWESREIWDLHMKTAHVAKISELEPTLTVKPTVLNFYESAK
jgi:quinol monooxygenase YgiN